MVELKLEPNSAFYSVLLPNLNHLRFFSKKVYVHVLVHVCCACVCLYMCLHVFVHVHLCMCMCVCCACACLCVCEGSAAECKLEHGFLM